ncbi:THP2 domain containing protein [Ceratobasidium theobromae]|uniref:THP2 domain containing protein n=1 Tax=Ceratobasidium theobromae TaxID=1582974 RepID=A0A5N5QHA7_9AGAM|nr:THP2 domain containing protein [Ceratobasidium theobromae]
MAPSTTPQRLSLGGERKPSPLRTSALKSEKPLASPSVSVMEFDGENGEVITRKPRPSGQEARPRVRSGGVGRTLSNGNTAMQSPDVAGLEQLKQTMQATLGVLGTTFDYLGEQTARVAALGPAVEASHQIHQLRRQVHAQDRKQEERMQEIKSLLQDVLKEQIAEHLRAHVFEMIREKIEEYVADKVRDQLQKQIPEALRQQVKDHRKHLAEVKRCLNNSEARRANATLRNHGSAIREPLHPLLMTDGNMSELWPADLAQLFGYSNDTAKRLLDDYELTYAHDDPTERMLNKFMAHIGVGFQMVPPQRRPPLQISSM